MTPATYDFSVVRGSSGPTQGLKFRLKAKDGDDLVNITYENVRLSIYKRKELILRVSLDEGSIVETNPSEAELAWVPTTAQTRLIPEGENKSHYELEVWNADTEIVYMLGQITGIGGINDDESDGAS